MNRLRNFGFGLRALFRQNQNEQELDDEIQSFVEASAERRVHAGMNRDEALRAARAELGSTAAIKDYVHDAGWESWLENLGRDLRYALRMLRRNPGFSAAVIGILSLGIGANTALFSVVNAVLFKSLPVKSPGQLVLLEFVANGAKRPFLSYDGSGHGIASNKAGAIRGTSFPYAAFQNLAEKHDALQDVFAFGWIEQLNVVANGQAEIASGQYVSGDYYRGFGLEAWRGRVLTDEDDKRGAGPVAVITWNYWQRRFGGDPRVVGMTVGIDNLPFTIVGVTPPGFVGAGQLGESADVTIPMATEAQLDAPRPRLQEPAAWWLIIMGRLKPGMAREQAQASLEPVLLGSLTESLKAASSRWNVKVSALTANDYPRLLVQPGGQGEIDTQQQYRQPLMVLMVVVGLALLIACINVANLLLARSAARQQEIAVRLSLGATTSRLIRQLLTESLLLSLVAGGVGCLLAFWGKDILSAWSPWANGNLNIRVTLDGHVLGFTLGLSLLTGILFGSLPALRASRPVFTPMLKVAGGGTGERSRSALGRALVLAQVMVSLVLLVAAGLFVRTLRNLEHVDVGFDRNNLLLFRVKPEANGYNAAQSEQLYGRMLERMSDIPGIRSVALSRHPLLAKSQRSNNIFIPGRTKEGETVQINVVSPSFFDTMRMPLLLGRSLSERDNHFTQRVAVVNQAFVRKYFPDVAPLGQRFALPGKTGVAGKDDYWEIIGISRDAKYTDVRSEINPTIYQSYLQQPTLQANFEVSYRGNETTAIFAVRQAVHEVDAKLPLFDLQTQEQVCEESLGQERLFARLSGVMSSLALLLAAVGLYGTMSYAVARRTREIGVRLALGARRSTLILMVLRETLSLVFAGIVIGIPAAITVALAARKLLASLLFGVKTTDPAAVAIATLLLAGVALIAGLLPAWRAAKTDPIVALRCE